MKKRKHKMNKKKKFLLLGVLGIFLVVGLLFTFPSLFHEANIDFSKPSPEYEAPKLEILDLDSHSRPIAVMINNIGVARPYQTGLQDAYMVYEMIVEGGITRMLALYKDVETAKIGTIRSARHYFLDYVLENDAVYVHWGYSEYAKNDISKLGIHNIDGMVYGNQYFWKDRSLRIATEHTAYSSMDMIHQGMERLRYRNTTDEKPLLNYSIAPVNLQSIEGAVPATNVVIPYSRSAETEYVYDEEAKVYKRSVNQQPHIDYDTKEQYTAKNIITYQVRNTTISGDVKGRQDLDNLGRGEGYYISEGLAVPITWEKKSREGKTIYRLKDGTELTVNDGNTYIQIQPLGQSLTIS